MDLLLFTPLRTVLGLRRMVFFSAPEEGKSVLDAARRACDAGLPARVTATWNPESRHESRYLSRNDDDTPSTFQPALRIDCDVGTVERMLGDLHGRLAVRHVAIDLYDSTVAVLHMRCRLLRDLPEAAELRPLEHALSLFGEAAAREATSRVLDPVVAAIAAAHRDVPRRRPRLVIEPGQNWFFDPPDRERLGREGRWPPERALAFWTARVLILGTGTLSPDRIDALLGSTADLAAGDLAEHGYAAGVGNSLLAPRDGLSVEQFSRVFSALQFWYAFLDIVERRLRVLGGEALRAGASNEIGRLARVAKGLEFELALGLSDFHDMHSGLQAERRLAFDAVRKAWALDELQVAVSRKMEMVRGRIADLTEQRRGLYQGFVEGALIVIGGMAVLDFATSLWTYGEAPERAGQPLAWLVSLVSLEKVLAAGLAAILVVCVMQFRGRD